MSALPVGSILPFAGEPTNLEELGWLVCNGREVPRTTYPELFQAIGTGFGSSGASVFNLPDFRGLFPRCVMGNAPNPETRDPDANDRSSIALGGNRGNQVGSVQSYGTAPPRNSFQTDIRDTRERNCDNGCGTVVASYTSSSVTVSSYSGGDLETRPANRNVFYIVKYCAATGGEPVIAPVGAVVPYAGAKDSTIPSDWLICNGLSMERSTWATLFAAIGTAHGSADATHFNLPDYRGTFLRGVDLQSGRDKNSATRTAPAPGGNEGDRVGSAQDFATALPVASSFSTSVPHIPTSDGPKDIDGTMKTYYKYNSGDGVSVLTQKGGDSETRPRNYRVRYLIRSNETAAYPVGAVVLTGMATTRDGWLACDGSSLIQATYPELFAVLGTTYGGDATTFKLPDYRGFFLRGGDDTVAVGAFEDYTTGLPKTPIQGVVPHLPYSTAEGHGETQGGVAGENGNQTINTCNGGGDKETRPINIYAMAYIKATAG